MILQGDNVICASETGSGKTLAYLVPLVDKLIIRSQIQQETDPQDSLRVNSPRALILVPNRELATQTYEMLVKMLKYTELNAEVVIGGERTQRKLNHPKYSEIDVLVSTPGVLSKLITNRLQDVSRVHTVVIDEADTMVDDSFSDLVRRILGRMMIQGGGREGSGEYSRGAQLVLVGATMPRSLLDTFDGIVPIESLTRVATKHLHKFAPHVKQTFHRTKPGQKAAKALELVKSSLQAGQIMMIFCRSSETCNWLSQFLEENGVLAPALNGAMMQRFRRGRFEQFQRGEFRCLVCTDIASRGLDTTLVTHILNYDFPQDISDYIHRTGRTGRIGASDRGQVTSFITYPDEAEVVHKIERAVRAATVFENVNANITRRINIKYGMTQDQLKSMGKMRSNMPSSQL
ncbi:putative ATP-dependent RNA helicase DDX28 [Hypsibius exemplaris]|uniref:ATP-dependent RNA helicase DDX28 n=1 Tax=Hypsibius exemplaris TaxID=2072580 RepID=A0A9X6NHD4_HYPEX|nr:putative ATP-dependent RNA helicase DDX28 [Hypsibius exemplaris]